MHEVAFAIAVHCPAVSEMKDGPMRCMVCAEDPAYGHCEVRNGPFANRVVLFQCKKCGEAMTPNDLREILAQQLSEGYITILGGPGPNGSPTLFHNGMIATIDSYQDIHEDPPEGYVSTEPDNWTKLLGSAISDYFSRN
jgi:hypothetical protein